MSEAGPRSGISEDWAAVWLGLFIFLLSLGALAGADLLGWSAKPEVWISLDKALGAVSSASTVSPVLSLAATILFVLIVMAVGARMLGADVRRFVVAFAALLAIAYVCWIVGHYAYIAATTDKLGKFGISWSMSLTGEAGYIVALIVGLVIANFFKPLAEWFAPALKSEWYIKTAVVIMGAALGVKSAEVLGLANHVILRGICAVIEAYLVYWAVVYFIARRYFGFAREWAAPLASGISICGVSAAIATGAAIRARPIVPITVSSLVVIFAVIELLLLPFLARQFLYEEPMVAGAWMGLAVKTDGAALASGAIAESLIRGKALAEQGINYAEGWILMATTTTKVFIDVFIGVWAFILAIVWAAKIEPRSSDRPRAAEIWQRFPKFVLGYVLTFLVMLLLVRVSPELADEAKKATGESNVYRQLFFVLTFLSIGMITDFRKLWQEGMGRLAAVYSLSLFGFIIWIGFVISWLFFSGIKPPLAGS
ncbi:MAG TPA: putative sulfate exporter family transporter [Steroidobacter sp.]